MTRNASAILATSGTDLYGRNRTPLSAIVIRRFKDFGGSDTVAVQAGVALPPMTTLDGDLFLARIIDTDPSRPPAELDEVRADGPCRRRSDASNTRALAGPARNDRIRGSNRRPPIAGHEVRSSGRVRARHPRGQPPDPASVRHPARRPRSPESAPMPTAIAEIVDRAIHEARSDQPDRRPADRPAGLRHRPSRQASSVLVVSVDKLACRSPKNSGRDSRRIRPRCRPRSPRTSRPSIPHPSSASTP